MSWCNLLETASRNTFCVTYAQEKRCNVIDSRPFKTKYCSVSYNGTHGTLNIDSKINCHLCVLSFFHIDWSFHMYCCRFLTNMTKFGISLSLYILMNPVSEKWGSKDMYLKTNMICKRYDSIKNVNRWVSYFPS